MGFLLWLAQKILDAAEQERRDPAAVRARLRELERLLESGMISEQDFDQAEDELLDLLATGERPPALGDREARR